MESNYQVFLSPEQEAEYLVAQGDSLLFDQIRRLRGSEQTHIPELILVTAKKSPKTSEALKHILTHGFSYNNKRFLRFGKSASQSKDGITAFVSEDIFESLYRISQMDLPVKECVISKYESQRCLLFSACTLVRDYMPRIIIIGEYQKILKEQYIRYIVNQQKEIVDTKTGERRTVTMREVAEGKQDVPLSPFDGCGCHELEFAQKTSQALGLDYTAVGNQVRLPFLKGFSVYVPFREILKEMGISQIQDIYGNFHRLEDIDCIWNISMFKGHSMFFEAYGKEAFNTYLSVLKKYGFKLGISKYSHHKKDFPLKSRMNFQYLQCLNLWNDAYKNHVEQKTPYDILAPETKRKITKLAEYTTDLFEKIINGEELYSLMFLGYPQITPPYSKYMQAIQINRRMLKDPAIRQSLYRKLKKRINDAKLGKIYADGFYHTLVGDMIGYLEFAAGKKPVGCLGAGEFYAPTLPDGEVLSFRSPLMDPSEVNQVRLVRSQTLLQWFSHFKDQDIAMINMYDLSLPQQGGADCDGDAVFLCCDPALTGTRINKPIIIDIADKTTAERKPYTLENLISYEIATRDSRIGEITNCATSIENKLPKDEKTAQNFQNMSSLLRVIQGKEIDSIKTGIRWHLNNGLRWHLKKLPWFLIYNYPKKRKSYEQLQQKNRNISDPSQRLPSPVYFSPSPMNELCDYICTWEKHRLLWDNTAEDNRDILLNHKYALADRRLLRQVRHMVNDYNAALRALFFRFAEERTENDFSELHLLTEAYRQKLLVFRDIVSEEELANYVIKVCYSNTSIGKLLAWSVFGDYILQNLRENSPQTESFSIQEVSSKEEGMEYLGKYYILCTNTDTRHHYS
ncbi:hypothetical protein D3Z36_10400 [Lachnospiraceae bacterium]|nr:hypothetical protein [Lachnospiraceae bacterium]